MNTTNNAADSRRKPLSVWELPILLQSLHEFRRPPKGNAKKRKHFSRILAFIYRNRYAVAAQIRRRFPEDLPSDRTARRHLAEIQALGWIDTVSANNVSPLFPKVYFVAKRGLAQLRAEYQRAGRKWTAYVADRRRSEGARAAHIVHELCVTETLLMLWEATQQRVDLELLGVERRSLCVHPSFRMAVSGRRTRLEPDAFFVLRQQGTGMAACFLEVDAGTCTRRQLEIKWRRYREWSASQRGREFLIEQYRKHGAQQPRPTFRVLVVACGQVPGRNDKGLQDLIAWSQRQPEEFRCRLWFISADALASIQHSGNMAGDVPWLGGDLVERVLFPRRIGVMRP